MVTTVEQLAVARGRSVDDVLTACRSVNVLAWSGFTPLDATEIEAIDRFLGGPVLPPPGAMPPPQSWGPPPPPLGAPPPPGGYQVPPGYAPFPQPPSRPPRTGKAVRWLGGFLAFAAVVGVRVGLRTWLDGDDTPSTSEPVPFAETIDEISDDEPGSGETESVEVEDALDGNFAVGVCFDHSAVVESASCDGFHDAEVFLVVNHPDGPDGAYPGDDAVVAYADEQCFNAFAGFVGRSYEESALDFSYLYPSEVGWLRFDDREVVCAVMTVDGTQLQGSVAGSGR